MGGCFSSRRHSTNTIGASIAPKTQDKVGAADTSVGSRAAAAATAAVASAEDLKARARRRALRALVESLQHGESVIPNSKWRGQFLKTNAVGPAVISTIANYMQRKTGPPTAGAAETTASATKPGRAKHSIRTLDLRALRAGDDGFVEMMLALLDDTLVENVIFAGNEITDDGVQRLIKHIEARTGSAANASAKASLPCQLKFIGLTDNLISSSGIATLATIAPVFRTLEQLEVGRGLSGGGEDVDEVRDTLSLTDVKAISSYIQDTPTLVTFLYQGTGNYYARSGFSPDGFSLFVDTVVGHSGLQELYLQDCFTTRPAMVGPVTVQAPHGKAAAAASSATTDEQDESWSAEQILKPIQTLQSSLCVPSTQLCTLVLRFPLSDDAVQMLAKGLAQAPHLENLSLRGCDMSGKALSYIGDALATNRALHMLDVSYQSNSVAHPAYLAEMRSSSRRRFSYTGNGGAALTAAEIARQELSSGGGSEAPSREERQHPLLPIIRSLHQNRTLVQLVMLGVNVSIEDIEELCACIERSGNKTLTEVWYTTSGNDALKMKLEDFLAANREYGAANGGDGAGGIGPSAVSSVRSSVMRSSTTRVSGSCANLFPDNTSQSDHTEAPPRTPTEWMSTAHNTNGNIPYSPSPVQLQLPHHPPRPGGNAPVNGNAAENTSAERHSSLSLSSTTLNLKAGAAKPAANGDSRSVMSNASPSQVTVSLEGNVGKSTASPRSRTLRFADSNESSVAPPSADGTADTRTVPYTSQLPSARKARQT